MAFQLSPGVTVVEKDFSSIVPAVSTSAGAFAGSFPWGPVLDPVTVTSENVLVQRFGKPTDANAQSFFTAANFLSYTNNLLVVRTDNTGQRNAVATKTGSVTSTNVSAAGTGYIVPPTVTFSAPTIAGGITATGTAVLTGQTVTGVTVTNPGSGYTTPPSVTFLAGGTVTGVTMGVAGSGYTSAPTVGFTAPQIAGGVTATGTAVRSGGAVTAVAVTTGGTGYTSPTVTFSAPQVAGGTNAIGTVTVVSGVITAIAITTPGTGYTTAPTATLGNLGSGVNGVLGAVSIAASTITGVTVTNPGSGYTSAPTVSFTGGGGSAATATAAVSSPSGAAATASIALAGVKINNFDSYSTNYINGNGLFGEWAAKYPGTLGNSIKVSMADSVAFNETVTVQGITSYVWPYRNEFDSAPGTSAAAAEVGGTNDELHVIVIDADGTWTGTSGSILEKFAFVSKASDNKKSDGSNNYYRDVINSQSRYVWWMDHATVGTNWGSVDSTAFTTLTTAYTVTLSGGVDDLTATDGQLQTAYSIFANDELYDISLVALGKASTTVATYVINNVVEVRKDCIAFISPQNTTSGDVITGTGSDAVNALVAYRNALPSTSYAVLDSGYKYQYDRYNDKYRYIPLNGDIAGLCARTDYTDDPWFSPGGFNRGQVKNVVKLAVNPGKTERDNLYKAGVNPVVNFPGQGTVLFGDKTLLAKPSAFDRINVRRLFIVLEKAIATAAKFQLFEFNDAFTRAQFRNLVEPFLRDVQGRRGVTDFRVKCDESNNTGEIIDRNEFVSDIFIKPNRSINFITLNFVAARSSVSFEEIGA